MTTTSQLLAAAVHGAIDVRTAADLGIAKRDFYRATAGDGWRAPLPGVRIAADAPRGLRQDLVAVTAATTKVAAAAGLTAAWLHGSRSRARRPALFVVAHGTDVPMLDGTRGRRARWLTSDDVESVDGVPTLVGPALALSAARLPAPQLRALLIDLGFHRLCTAEQVVERLEREGPLEGRATLAALAEELVGREVESIFQDDVVRALEELGYRPTRSVTAIPTPDGIGLRPDAVLEDWLVALEPSGDAYHRTREQRRIERRRVAAYAGTDHVCVPIDWRDWRDDRDAVLDQIDDAVAAQRRNGIGADVAPPVRPRRRRGPGH